MKTRIENQAGVFGARYGLIGGMRYLFTHRNPKTGEYYAESIPSGGFQGGWFPGDVINFE